MRSGSVLDRVLPVPSRHEIARPAEADPADLSTELDRLLERFEIVEDEGPLRCEPH